MKPARKKHSKQSNLFKFIFKLLVSALLIFLVIREIDINDFKRQLKAANGLYLFLAFASIFLGQVFGSLRMRYYAHSLGIAFTKLYSLSFYFIGTLFNIVLPGGIGGDGYKAYYFQKRFRYPWQKTVLVVLRGRASGLLVLCFKLCVSGIFYSAYIKFEYALPLFVVGLVMLFPAYSFLAKKILKEPVEVQIGALTYSLPTQIFYLFAIFFIIYSLNTFDHILGYILVFLIANIVAVIPISFGGIGLREYTFIQFSALMSLETNIGVAASMLFYLLYTLNSLLGFIPYMFIEKLDIREIKHIKKSEIL